MSVAYFTTSDAAPAAPLAQPVAVLPQVDNPIFNFDQSFVDKLQSLSAVELAKKQPYVSLKSIDLNGEVIHDFNFSFFKSIDMGSVSSGLRYSDRPLISLKEVEIKTDLASGYLYYTRVFLKLRLHSPEMLTSDLVLSLMFPGMPHLLEYGWNTLPEDSFLNDKENLLFTVKTYTVNLDKTGQVDLTIEGMAMNDRFGNTYVGDHAGVRDLTFTNEKQLNGVKANLEQIQQYIAYLNTLKQSSSQNARDNNIIKSLATSYETAEKKVRKTITKNFGDKKKAIMEDS